MTPATRAQLGPWAEAPAMRAQLQPPAEMPARSAAVVGLGLTGGMGFDLPAALEASEPPEARGLTRDAVRMLVTWRGSGAIAHATFFDLPLYLCEGDLIVINTSGTLAAEVPGIAAGGRQLDVHLSTQLPAGLWTVELRKNGRPLFDAAAGEVIELPAEGRVTLLAPYAQHWRGVRLWVAQLGIPGGLSDYLVAHGRPISYGYVRGEWPMSAYQNVYVTEPGSAEMPSAGRPFSPEVITRLVARGIGVTPLLLHTGVASLEAGEPPYDEFYRVPDATARRVNAARRDGGRVIAVGTTVVRALESVVDTMGNIHPGSGWTDVIVAPDRPVRSVDGLLTGWHEPEASHLAMLEALAGRELLERSYTVALEEGYLWHEFGDVHLVLP
ncbi:MAG: S-adenosylmethionine:tRNA ribosyltransferase-isomerase [Acidimicrobiales bacterium]